MSMRRYFFDVTDIVRYASGNTRVSGIQRVQLNIVAHLVRKHGGETMRCTFEHPRRKVMYEFDPTTLIEGDEFDAEMLLRRLGLARRWRLFPSGTRIRSHLRQYTDNKLLRTAVKCDIYVSALFFPQRLVRMGLRRPTQAELAIRPVDLRRVERLPPDSTYVYLGATWSMPRVTAFGQAHAARGGDLVQLIYDLIPHVHPEYVTRGLSEDFALWLNEIAQYTRRFVCISRWTAAELGRFFGNRNDLEIQPIALAHEFGGFDRFELLSIAAGDAHEAAKEPFVLCVGTLEVRKNGKALLEAWRRLRATLGDRLPRLVFAGKQGWLLGEFRRTLAGDADLFRSVRIVDSPSDHELAYLYQRCLFTAYPSLSEGWGLPVGESAWFGKYCISSSATSLPEVCGDLVDYVDPHDIDSLCTRLQRAIEDPAYVRDRERRIAAAPMRRWLDVADDIHAFASRQPPATAGCAEPRSG